MTGQTQRRRAPGEVPRAADPTAPPPFLDLDDLERRARAVLDPAVVDYYAGGAGTETSLAEAPVAWRTWRLRPRVLRGVTATTATTLLGSAVATPVGVAPWAYQAMAHPGGELATARGAAAAGALMCVSTSANHSVEEVAAATGGAPAWFQLYAQHSPAHTDDLARRAGDAGYRALVLTVDLPVLGRRHRDLRNDFALPAGLRMANHPAPDDRPPPAADDDPGWVLADVGRFAELSGLPVVVKGVLRGDDAVACVQAGASAVWVSAHGGRQVDLVVPSAHALPEVVDAVRGETGPDGGDVEVYADGGVRTGSDALVALALGARAVFLGRPTVWGLTCGGADGVTAVLAGLTGELAHTMTLCGVATPAGATPDLVTRYGWTTR
ncbi:alpha-hydroxy acid oxidase [Klenkia brasiliensis]|uniref:4-hydroxymandelate oxidase n=1 Tax=Klenkia brasiliensis TaxID=333142 RepID=A0A1G7V6P3_9ACTN|nr:alpha-hydroxy acid oxidase [Klenkia brasiliensis]SDG55436.1 4-hydroxymandelate oxidase [Klenkia brasiliensis]